MIISIIGTGAVGGYFGSLMARQGYDVRFLFNNDYEHISQHGLRIESDLLGEIRLPQINAYNNTADMPPSDVVLVCLKTINNAALLPALLPPLLKPDTLVVLVQNGFGLEEELDARMPGLNLAGGLAFIGAARIAPGHIRHQFLGRISVGGYGLTNTTLATALVDAMNASGIPAIYSDDLPMLRWRKLIWNIAFNGPSTILDADTIRLLAHPSSRALLTDLMAEVINGAEACGVVLERTLIDEQLTATEQFGPYRPSMMLDYLNRRPMEIRHIYDNPIREAAAHGYEMRKVKTIADQLHFLEASYASL